MKETLETINRMQAEGVIGRYAIGDAIGATLYLEPAATLDLDVFIAFPSNVGGSIVSLAPIYEYLTALGYESEGEHINIGTWPVQFLLPGNALEEEALNEAVETKFEDISTWVMRGEHLVAIALQTGRAKDHARILQFLEQNAVDRAKLDDILVRHGLKAKWQKFQERYLNG
ncbi:MAG TPA: hypothetical protein VJA94_08510 [Candidatus Angelobacter sp.]